MEEQKVSAQDVLVLELGRALLDLKIVHVRTREESTSLNLLNLDHKIVDASHLGLIASADKYRYLVKTLCNILGQEALLRGMTPDIIEKIRKYESEYSEVIDFCYGPNPLERLLV